MSFNLVVPKQHSISTGLKIYAVTRVTFMQNSVSKFCVQLSLMLFVTTVYILPCFVVMSVNHHNLPINAIIGRMDPNIVFLWRDLSLYSYYCASVCRLSLVTYVVQP